MSEQLSMLDLWDPNPSFALGPIELHQHTDGRWMWSSSYGLEEQSSGYKVGPKWGRFAETRAGALHGAVTELTNAIDGRPAGSAGAAVLTWAKSLK